MNETPFILPDGRMDVKNAALYVGFSPNSLNMWRTTGEGPLFVKIKGKVFYRRVDLDDWLMSSSPSKTTAQARLKRVPL